jgi:hypothetical protein
MTTITYQQIRDQMDGEPYEMTLAGNDGKVVAKVVDQGIDAHLEACFVQGQDEYKRQGGKLVCYVTPESLPVLLRRLTELDGDGTDGDDADTGGLLATDILNSLDIDVQTGEYTVVNDPTGSIAAGVEIDGMPPEEYASTWGSTDRDGVYFYNFHSIERTPEWLAEFVAVIERQLAEVRARLNAETGWTEKEVQDLEKLLAYVRSL